MVTAGGSVRKVKAFQQQGLESAQGAIPGSSDTSDAATDDNNVKLFILHF